MKAQAFPHTAESAEGRRSKARREALSVTEEVNTAEPAEGRRSQARREAPSGTNAPRTKL